LLMCRRLDNKKLTKCETADYKHWWWTTLALQSFPPRRYQWEMSSTQWYRECAQANTHHAVYFFIFFSEFHWSSFTKVTKD